MRHVPVHILDTYLSKLNLYDKYPYYSERSDLTLPIRKPTTHDYQSKNRLILKIKHKYFLIKTNYVYHYEKQVNTWYTEITHLY